MTVRDGVAWVELARPTTGNALDDAMLGGLVGGLRDRRGRRGRAGDRAGGRAAAISASGWPVGVRGRHPSGRTVWAPSPG